MFATNRSANAVAHPAHTVIAHREYELNSKNSTQNDASLRVYAESQFLHTNLYKQYLKIQDKYAKSLNRLRTMQRLGKAKRMCTSNQKHYTKELTSVKPKKKGPFTPHAQERWACLPLSQKYLYEFMIGEQRRQQQIDESLLANTDLHQLGMSFNTSQTISVHKQHTNDADDFINLTNDGAQGMKHIYFDDSQKKKSQKNSNEDLPLSKLIRKSDQEESRNQSQTALTKNVTGSGDNPQPPKILEQLVYEEVFIK